MPTKLSIKGIVLRAVALKMATWSQAILHRLEASGRAESQPRIDGSVGELIEKTSSAPPVSAGAEPVSSGPPVHWLERIRQGAPQLLRPVHQPVERAPLEPGPPPLGTKKTAAPLQTPEDQPDKPCFPAGSSAVKESTPQSWQVLERAKHVEAGIPRSRSARPEQHTEPAYPATDRPRPPLIQSTPFRAQPEQKRLHSLEPQARTASNLKHGPQSFLAPAHPRHKSSENRAKFPTELSKRLPKRLPFSSVTSPRSAHAEALDGKENSVARVRSSNISRDHLRETSSPQPALPETPFRPHESQRTASVFSRDGMVRAAPAAASLNFPLEPSEDLWPQLPETADPLREPLATIRERERLRRLDDEQRGIYGTRRISA